MEGAADGPGVVVTRPDDLPLVCKLLNAVGVSTSWSAVKRLFFTVSSALPRASTL